MSSSPGLPSFCFCSRVKQNRHTQHEAAPHTCSRTSFSSRVSLETPWSLCLPGPQSSRALCAVGLPSSFSSLYICLMNISISQAQLFPLNKQSADFIAGLLLTYLFRALNHSQETLGKVESGFLAMGPSCQHLPCRAQGMPGSHRPARGWKRNSHNPETRG